MTVLLLLSEQQNREVIWQTATSLCSISIIRQVVVAALNSVHLPPIWEREAVWG